jgi:hypothetical protein
MPLLGNHVLLILGYHVNREIGFRATDAIRGILRAVRI